ncbi:MAG: aminoglycoside phosphotransferase family protein [Myxococcales bacterium]|nr:aminoglycoside phosphotransferase family protein [Myxococcales bacterium]
MEAVLQPNGSRIAPVWKPNSLAKARQVFVGAVALTALSSASMDDFVSAALARYDGFEHALVEPFGNGLIHMTNLVTSTRGTFVLQRVNPIFERAIHDNIAAVTAALKRAELVTPTLVLTRTGAHDVLLDCGALFRMLTFIDGASFDAITSLEQAHAAAQLIARFHAALATSPHPFRALRLGVHDTRAHMTKLAQAIAASGEHRLFDAVRPFAAEIFTAFDALPPLPSLPRLVGHGDLKLNNVRFAGTEAPAHDHAVCLLDLDTVGPIHFGHELGDMWRSWCNPGGEDALAGGFDLAIYEASLAGYVSGRGARLSAGEREALVLGVEHIALELAARFLADALFESYFGFDSARFASRGEHNLVRGCGQLALFRAVVACRSERAASLARS